MLGWGNQPLIDNGWELVWMASEAIGCHSYTPLRHHAHILGKTGKTFQFKKKKVDPNSGWMWVTELVSGY